MSPDASVRSATAPETPAVGSGASAPAPPKPGLRNLWPGRLAAAWSGLLTVVGLWWRLDPGAYPFGVGDPHGDLSLLAWTHPVPAAVVLLVAGPIGVVVALAVPGRPAVVVGSAYAVTFGLLVPDIQLLIVFTYLVAGLGPPVLVVLLLAGARHSPVRAVVIVAGVAVLSGAAAELGLLGGRGLVHLGGELLAAGAALGTRPLLVAFIATGGAVWCWLAVSRWREVRGRCAWCGRVGAAWTRPAAAARWGRWVTVLAALGTVPYGVLRLTWLLPSGWRFAPPGLETDPGLRLWGLMIGLAAFAGAALTLGLTMRWGTVWPPWFPVVHGRPVPPRLPVVTVAVVAELATTGGISVLRQAVPTRDWAELFGFPTLLWGPLLAAAGLAYHYRRRPACRHCGRGVNREPAVRGDRLRPAAGPGTPASGARRPRPRRRRTSSRWCR